LAIDETIHDHPDVGIDHNNLGAVLRDLGDLDGAKAQFEQALAIYEAALGPDHSRTTNTMGALTGLDQLRADDST